MSAAGFEVVYRASLPPQLGASGVVSAWHHDSYHTTRQKTEARVSELILSGLQVRIVEVS